MEYVLQTYNLKKQYKESVADAFYDYKYKRFSHV